MGQSILDANEAILGGFYYWGPNAKNTPFRYGAMVVIPRSSTTAKPCVTQIASEELGGLNPQASIAVRKSTDNGDGKWGPWEWLNPPMELGVEYRTTERHLGKPVYCKLIDFGAVPAVNTNKTVDFAGLGISRIISWTGNADIGGSTFALPYHEIGRKVNNASIYVFVNYTGITLRTDDQWFAENGGTAQCTIWYTKTAD